MSLTLTLERGGGEVSGSGTNIELNGTISGGAIESVEMYGDTEQTTYSGKNLYEGSPSFSSYSNISAWEDGGTYNGMPVIKRAAAWTGAYRLINIEAGATYTFSAWVKSDEARSVAIYAIGSGATATITPNNKNITTSTSWERVSFTFTCSTSGTVALRFENTSASTTNYTYISGYQLEKNSSATSFEPYVGGTASPNPDYPQEVQTVTGRQVVTITDGGSESQEYEINLGKNLFDKDNANVIHKAPASSGNSLSTGSYYYSVYIPAIEGMTYTFSDNSSSLDQYAKIFFLSEDPTTATTFLTQQTRQSGSQAVTATAPSGAKYLCIYLAYTVTQSVIDDLLEKLQIEKGSVATTYAPYFTPIELCKIGDYQDYIYKSGEDWYVHKETGKLDLSSSTSWWLSGEQTADVTQVAVWVGAIAKTDAESAGYSNILGVETLTEWGVRKPNFSVFSGNNYYVRISSSLATTAEQWQSYLSTHTMLVYYVLRTPTDTQITNEALIAQLNALNAGTTYDGTTIITVASENLAGPLEVKASATITKTYTEVEVGSPFTIADVEGKSSNTTLDGNVYVDWAYNKKQYSFDLFNLTPQDYADIRAFYDYQFDNSAFPTITVPELNIDKLPVYMEISSRNIINQCLLTDKLTIKFRETVQP